MSPTLRPDWKLQKYIWSRKNFFRSSTKNENMRIKILLTLEHWARYIIKQFSNWWIQIQIESETEICSQFVRITHLGPGLSHSDSLVTIIQNICVFCMFLSGHTLYTTSILKSSLSTENIISSFDKDTTDKMLRILWKVLAVFTVKLIYNNTLETENSGSKWRGTYHHQRIQQHSHFAIPRRVYLKMRYPTYN